MKTFVINESTVVSHWIVLLLAILLTPKQCDANDVFLKLDGIQGESKDPRHAGEIEVISWNWGTTLPVTLSQSDGGGATAGRPLPDTLKVSKGVDRSTPAVLEFLSKGKTIANAVLVVRRSSPKSEGDRIEYVKLTLQRVFVARVEIAASNQTDRLQEEISLEYATMKLDYVRVDLRGAPSGTFEVFWDFATGKGGGSSIDDDKDGDGMPDDWESLHGLSPLLPDGDQDLDGDGLSNSEEFQMGTDPANANSVFRTSITHRAGDATAALSWPSLVGKSYRVSSAKSLGTPFLPFAEFPASNNGATTITLPATILAQFFRVEALP